MTTVLLILMLLALAAALALAAQAWGIWRYGRRRSQRHADAAIVLGAAVWNGHPSPVFRERLNHGIALWRAGRVRRIVLTGGRADYWGIPESEAARRYVRHQGVPEEAIVCEAASRTTFENMIEARRVLAREGLRTALVVSDPIHMKRAMTMARDAGLRARPSPTPTTRYLTWRKRATFLAMEAWALTRYRMNGY